MGRGAQYADLRIMPMRGEGALFDRVIVIVVSA